MSLMKGKKGLIMGVANERSIAWGISQKLAEAGAELAFTYLGDALKKRVIPLAEKLNSKTTFSCDVEKKEDVTKLFEDVKSQWGEIDFVVHAIAFSDKSELSGEYLNTTRENFLRSMLISCFSFTEVAKEASKVMKEGGSLITLSYEASKAIPNYNVMGVCKSALEASVKYLARDLGSKGMRVNAISAGPIKTLAASAIGDAKFLYNYYEQDGNNSPVTGGIGTEELSFHGPSIVVNVALDSVSTFHFDGGVDVYSSASTDNIDFNVSSASAKDARTHVRIGMSHFNEKKEQTITYNGSFSIESDYTSFGLGASYAKGFYNYNTVLSIVAQVKNACENDLTKVKSCIKLTGFVNSTEDFTEQPKVINGASDLIVSVFGDSGMHTRAAVSTNSLPLGVSVEVDAIFELN